MRRSAIATGRAVIASRREPLAALARRRWRSSRPRARAHPGAEAVGAGALALLRLIGALHRIGGQSTDGASAGGAVGRDRRPERAPASSFSRELRGGSASRPRAPRLYGRPRCLRAAPRRRPGDPIWERRPGRARAPRCRASTFELWLEPLERRRGRRATTLLVAAPAVGPRLGRAPLRGRCSRRSARQRSGARRRSPSSTPSAARRGRGAATARRRVAAARPEPHLRALRDRRRQPARPRRRARGRRGARARPTTRSSSTARPGSARPTCWARSPTTCAATAPSSTVHYTTAERFTTEFVTALRRDGTRGFKERYRELDVLLIDDVQFLEGKARDRGGVLPHLQRALRGRQADRALERPPAGGALAARRAPARPLRLGPAGRARAARPAHPDRAALAPRVRARRPSRPIRVSLQRDRRRRARATSACSRAR